MAFNYNNSDFIFESNENVTSIQVVDTLTQASQRILSKIKSTDWWQDYQFTRDPSLNRDVKLVPAVDPDNIILSEQLFKDLNIYFAFAEYLMPRVADFSNDSDVNKINFYKDQFNSLFKELIEDGSWYDFDADGTVEVTERQPSRINLVRIR
jgi:hypothetical protein